MRRRELLGPARRRAHLSRRLDWTKRERHIPSMPPQLRPADEQWSVPPPPVNPPVIACSFGLKSRISNGLILILYCLARARTAALPPDEVIE
jgi:hypothetical protein